VDSVLAIRKGLTGSEEAPSLPVTPGILEVADPLVGRVERNGTTADRVVVDMINGVPIYADDGLGSSGAVFP
jgi:hypothetical protein